jgi:molecular chaperone DnaJ
VQARGRDLETEVRLSFEQAVHGTELPVVVPKQSTCQTCHGSGAQPGTAPVTCPRCGGTGMDSESQGFFSISRPCPQCGGSGQIIEHPCETCGGSGLTLQQKRYRRKKAAFQHGASSWARSPNRWGGPRRPDVTRPHRGCQRPATPADPIRAEAIQGATVEVPTLNGTKKIRLPAGTQHGTVQRLRGEGPPRPGGKGRGDILYRIEPEVPKDLSSEQQQALGEFAKTMNDRNPRERVLRDASASSDKVRS